MNCIVYKIYTDVDDRIYIGSTINKKKRWNEHKRDLLNNRHVNIHLQNFTNKYGIDKLIFEIVEICNKEELLLREQYYLNTIKNLFNIALNATAPMSGKHHTDEAKKKIAIHSTGKNNPMYGIVRSNEVKNSIRKAQLHRIKTKEEKLLRLVKLKTRQEVVITKEDISIHCFSYSHAASIIGVKQQSISFAIKNENNSKGWIVKRIDSSYTEDLVMNNIELFSEDLHPQEELIEMLKNL